MVEEQQETLHEEDYVYDEKVQLEDFNSPTGCHTVIIAPERASEAHDWCWLNVGFRWSEWTCGLIGDNRGTFKIINPSKAALFKLGPVDIHRVARTDPTRWIIAAKLVS